MSIKQEAFFKGYCKMASDGARMGWHERNGGNLSYRLTEAEVAAITPELSEGNWQDIGTAVPTLGGCYFMVSGSGKFIGSIEANPEENAAIIEISADGTQYRIRWGLVSGGRPTSELPTHLSNHAVKLRVANGQHRVIYHCHATNLIALCFVLDEDEKTFTRALWETMTECPVIFPDGIGVVSWMVPGGKEIADASLVKMEDYDALVWMYHGLFVSGESFDLTFGLAHTIEKAAEIAVKVRSMGGKQHAVTIEELKTLEEPFGITLNPKFL